VNPMIKITNIVALLHAGGHGGQCRLRLVLIF